MIKALKWISVIGASLTIVGVSAIAITIFSFRQTDARDAWEVILGWIYWPGLFLSLVAAAGWIIVAIEYAVRRFFGRSRLNGKHMDGNDENHSLHPNDKPS